MADTIAGGVCRARVGVGGGWADWIWILSVYRGGWGGGGGLSDMNNTTQKVNSHS